jgi:superfamily II DNA or RNA helicase
MEKEFVYNYKETNLLNELYGCFEKCLSFKICVSFIRTSGVHRLLECFDDCMSRNVKGQIITTDYVGITQSSALRSIQEYKNIELKWFKSDVLGGLHCKGYIFEMDDCYVVFIGSSNISKDALLDNVEWNTKIVVSKEDKFLKDVIEEYDRIFNLSEDLTESLIKEYEASLENKVNIFVKERIKGENEPIKPRGMQIEALKKLNNTRRIGNNKALIVSATGTGKTYLSAFDVFQFNPKRLLYIVHNEVILKDAMASFQKVIRDKTFGFLTGSRKDYEADYIFATIQTFTKDVIYKRFKPDTFDYIIVDEAHKCAAPSYKFVFDYFKPKFLLGMTATPERTDSKDIFAFYDYNMPIEIRLGKAIDDGFITPFDYFGISDIVDMSHVDMNNDEDVAKKLMVNYRSELIVRNIKKHPFDGIKLKCLAFCATIKHAEYMKEEFNRLGYESEMVSGLDSVDESKLLIKRLQDENDPLKILCTVDKFNEGVDIPEVNMILMLRPTKSPIIFTQQLGRGLRITKTKSLLTVLDFISNNDRAFLVVEGLTGKQSSSRGETIRIVETDFTALSKKVFVHLDKKAKETILEKLEKYNFNNMLNLKRIYFSFKSILGNRVPTLADFLLFGNDDVSRLLTKENYYSFAYKIDEKSFSNKQGECLRDDKNVLFLNEVSDFLPLTKPDFYIIIKKMMLFEEATIYEVAQECSKYIENYSEANAIYSLEFITGKFSTQKEKKSFSSYFSFDGAKIRRTELFNEIIRNTYLLEFLNDIISYGLIQYGNIYGTVNYGVPFVREYSYYSARDLASLTMYQKSASSIRGSGIWPKKKATKFMFYFVDLIKGEETKPQVRYDDMFLSNKKFQWESDNATSQDSAIGNAYCHELNINNEKVDIYLFVRRTKKSDGVINKYINLGKIHPVSYKNNKPIKIVYELENEVPEDIYNDLIRGTSTEKL